MIAGATFGELELSDAHFHQISEWVRTLCGINLHLGKKELVKARLSKRVRQLELPSFGRYLELVRSQPGGPEMKAMLDALSTNLTSFFREDKHFEYLKNVVLSGLMAQEGQERRIRVWSAGCSSGEEPYSIAMVLAATLPQTPAWDIRILATDLSTRVLQLARQGVYDERKVQTVPGQYRQRFMELVQVRPSRQYRIVEQLRQRVHFSRLNLLDNWPMRGPIDVIFCRNVMIYFDKPTQAQLVERFWKLLSPGGTLVLGHSESLAGVRHKFGYAQPTVYQKR